MKMHLLSVSIRDIRPFIEKYHYSKSVNGCKVSKCYALYDDDEMVGAVLIGSLSTTAWKKYAQYEKDVAELRRLVCLDSCPRNTESWLISQVIKDLKKTTNYKICVSYADPYYSHVGYIYQASNWNYEGMTSGDKIFITPDGKRYHSRAMRTKYKGKYKPFAIRLQNLYKLGKLKEIKVPGKHIYTYTLKGKHIAKRINYPKIIFNKADIAQ